VTLAGDVEDQLNEARAGSTQVAEPPSAAELAVLRLLAALQGIIDAVAALGLSLVSVAPVRPPHSDVH
jgi:hypothetical protein